MRLSSLELSKNVSSGLVVFLVALPLCLGIALASGAPVASGIIAGIIGGIIVGTLSGSEVSVSGPAAGLAVIVFQAIDKLNSFEQFTFAVCLAGIVQILLGVFKLGAITSFFPTSAIKGMLAAIGIVLILKQIPHAVGWDRDAEGDFSFHQWLDGQNSFSEIFSALQHIDASATFIFISSFLFLLMWEIPGFVAATIKKWVPAPFLVVLVSAIAAKFLFIDTGKMGPSHLVQIPSPFEFSWMLPHWSFTADTLAVALLIAIVASVESLLSVEAADQLDKRRRSSNMNQELIAQGTGNFVSGFLGGIPITSVVVRTSAGIQAGATNRTSAIIHGLLMLAAVFTFSEYMNWIPLSALAAILILLGYKLCRVQLWKKMYKQGLAQFLPFAVTVTMVVFTDLLKGVTVGVVLGMIIVALKSMRDSTTLVSQEKEYLLRVHRDLTFLNKSEIKNKLYSVPEDAKLIVESRQLRFVDEDILDVFSSYRTKAKSKNIQLVFHGAWGQFLESKLAIHDSEK